MNCEKGEFELPRSRLIKPEFWSDRIVNQLSFESQLLYIGLGNFCDDYGCCLDSTRKISGEIFPLNDNVTERKVNKWRKELIDSLLVVSVQYDGVSYLIMRNWKQDQKVEHPSGRRWLTDEIQEKLMNEYIQIHEGLMRDSRPNMNMNKEDEIEKEDLKEKFSEFVFLTKKEHQKLVEKYGEEDTAGAIVDFDLYLQQNEANRKRYTSHYAVFLRWEMEAYLKKKNGRGKQSIQQQSAPGPTESTSPMPKGIGSDRFYEFAKKRLKGITQKEDNGMVTFFGTGIYVTQIEWMDQERREEEEALNNLVGTGSG